MLKTINCESCAKKVICKYADTFVHIKSEDGPFNVTIECPYFEVSPKAVNQCNIQPITPSLTFTMPMMPPLNGYIEIDDERAEKLGIINKKSEEKPMKLKDSGNRREFDTGAVRDIQEGKGRCDLIPLDVIGQFYRMCDYISYDRPTDIFECLDEFKVTGHTAHLHKAIWKFIEDVYPDPETAFLELSKHFEDGAKKYGDNNWQKGIPVSAYMDSAPRHYLKWLRGDDDEPHDRAFMWNIVCCIWTMTHKPELDNFTEKGNEKNGEQSETKWAAERASKKTDCKCSEERATR